jgi:hypothetical protein
VKIHDTALKHGIDPEDIMRAAAWPLWIEDLDDDSPARQLRLGFDTQGRLLETVVLIFDSGNELVIHAMTKDIVDELTAKHVKLSIGGSVHPLDPVGRLLFNVLAMVAEFESDLIRARTREGMQVAKAKGRLRGKQAKLSMLQQRHLIELHSAATHSTTELAELFNVARSTIYRTLERQNRTARSGRH